MHSRSLREREQLRTVRFVGTGQSSTKEKVSQCVEEHHFPVWVSRLLIGVIAVCRRSLGVLIQRRRSCPVEDSSIARVAMSQAFLLLEFSNPRTNVKRHVVKLAKRRSSRACLRERRWSVVRLASFYTHARRHTQVHQSQSHTHAHANTHTHTHTHTHARTHAHTHTHTHTHTYTRIPPEFFQYLHKMHQHIMQVHFLTGIPLPQSPTCHSDKLRRLAVERQQPSQHPQIPRDNGTF